MEKKTLSKSQFSMAELRETLEKGRSPQSLSRHFSVFIPVINIGGEPHLLYEVRASHMKTQPGEVCFPGGRLECGESPESAAIRETMEELGLCENSIHMIAEIDQVITPFNLTIHVFVGELRLENIEISGGNLSYKESNKSKVLSLNPDEVDQVFSIPISWLIENPPLVYTATSKMSFPPDFPFHLIQNGEAYNWRTGQYPIMFYQNEGPTIWGITARITQNLIEYLTL